MLLVLLIIPVTVPTDALRLRSDDGIFVVIVGVPVAAALLLLKAVVKLTPVVSGSALDAVSVLLELMVDRELFEMLVVEFIIVAVGMPVGNVVLLLMVDVELLGTLVVEFIIVAVGMPVGNVVLLLMVYDELLGMLVVKFPTVAVEFIIVAPGIVVEIVSVVLKPVGIVTLAESVAVAFMLSWSTVVLLLSEVGAAAVVFASTVVLSVALRGPLTRLLVALEEE